MHFGGDQKKDCADLIFFMFSRFSDHAPVEIPKTVFFKRPIGGSNLSCSSRDPPRISESGKSMNESFFLHD